MAFYNEFYYDESALSNYTRSVDLTNFPKGFLRWYNGTTDDERNRWYLERFLCLKYHQFLAGWAEEDKGDPTLPKSYTPILGMDFQHDPHDVLFAQFLQKRPGENKVLTDLETLTKKMMILWPRGLFKTSAIIVDIVQTILNYPNVRICFLTGGDNLAKRQLQRVKRIFEKPSKRFKFLFPEFCLESKRNPKIEDETDPRAWTDEQPVMGTLHDFTVPARTNTTFAEPTFAISTAKSVKAGSHFDIIFIDDLVNETNYRSPKLLEKCYQDYLDICPLLDPNGYIMMTGTRYSFGDTYERIQEKAKEEEKEIGRTIWKFFIRDCWSYGCLNCKHTSVYHDYAINIQQPPCTQSGCTCIGFQSDQVKGVLFPQARVRDGRVIGHTLEWLEGEKIRLGPESFANQYENSPIAAGQATFTEVQIGGQTLHDLAQIPSFETSFNFLVCDWAYIGQEGRDYTVIFANRKNLGRLFTFDCEYGNWGPSAVADNVVDMIFKHRPHVVFLEKANGWEAYDLAIRARAKERGLTNLPLQWLQMPNTPKAKMIRIGSVQGPLISKRLFFYSGMKGYDILVKQLVRWPKLGKNDDFADCEGMVVNAPTGYELEEPPPPPTGDVAINFLRRLNQVQSFDDSYEDNGCGSGIVC